LPTNQVAWLALQEAFYSQILCYNCGREPIMSDRIVTQPEVHFGKPCVAGTRITVENVLELVREGIPFAEIAQDYYPDLTIDDIRACVQYAIDVVSLDDIHPAATNP
jgi:uncharacterized protein (DUF433 family)